MPRRVPAWLCFAALVSLTMPVCISAQEDSIWIDNISLSRQAFTFAEDGHSFFFQDSRGFMWGADTDNKLFRFDGHSVESFPSDPADTFSHSGCSFWGNSLQFLEDSEGKIWIMSSESCLDRYDAVMGRFEKFKGWMQALAGEEMLAGTRDFLFEDSRKNIWVATNTGLFKYSLISKELVFYNMPAPVTLVFEDKSNNIWANVEKNNNLRYLARLDESTGKLHDQVNLYLPINLPSYYNRHDGAGLLKGKQVWLLFIGFNLLLFDPEKREVSLLPNSPFSKENFSYGFCVSDDLVLVGTAMDELYQILPGDLTFVKSPLFPRAVPGKEEWIDQIFKGNGEIIWLKKGRNNIKLLPQPTSFKKEPVPGNVSGYRTDVQYAGATLLFQGEVYFNTTHGLVPVRKSTRPSPILDVSITGIEDHLNVVYKFGTDIKGNLWMAASWYGKGRGNWHFRKFDPKGVVQYQYTCNSEEDCLPANYGLCFLEIDHSGRLWLGSRRSLACFDPLTSSFPYHFSTNQKDSPLFGNQLKCIYADRDNELWAGTTNAGLLRFNPKVNHWSSFDYGASGKDGNEMAVYSIFQDSKGAIWAGSEQALVKLDKPTGDYRRYTKNDLFSAMTTNKIFEDYRQNLWITVGSNLLLYYPKEDRFIQFDETDGVLPSGYYNQESFQDNDHFIYLSSNYFEVPYFHPDSLKINTAVPPVYFTDFQLANATVHPGDSTAILEKSLDFTESITLKYAQNDFTIHYTAPEYIHPNETVFAIQLEGFHDDWQEVGTKREARYTNLSPGTYTFKVKVRNHHGFWSETPRILQIVVLPPWYRTWWAYLLWAAIIGGSIYWFYRFQLNRRLAEAEALRLKELDLAKSRLYTNITHEFRTPLTVILGMAEQVKSDPKNWFNEGLQLIRRNGKQLLHLVNQLLDLSKLESGHMPLNLVQGDIVNYLKYLTESFHSYADSKDIRLHFASDFKELLMDYDPEKVQHILSNLLSNAIKFTPAGGDVYLDVRRPKDNDDAVLLQVRDNGLGISPEHLPRIFDRFYQADSTSTRKGEGTGIGLAMVKELVKLMGGEIGVESEAGKGAKFMILLPVKQSAQKAHTENAEVPIPIVAQTILLENEPAQSAPDVPHSELPLVLLIEDNADVITYLTSFLSSDYRIITATDGQQGIEKAIELTPDLVVSDVMMPEKDGFEVCATLKTDERTSHIPVILLTAKAGSAAKLEGLTHGADAYLVKPFNKEELLVRIEKLIELRRRLQERYAGHDIFFKNVIAENPTPEDLFLQKLVTIVERNLSDEHFGLPDLCRQAGLSRSQLFRKLKALTGKSTTHFIRSIRLAKGRELLETSDMTVSEVAYATGFSNLAYFSTMFREEFGVLPGGVRKG